MKRKKIALLLLALFGAILLLGYDALSEYLSPTPERVFSRTERRGREHAQSILENYRAELEAVAMAAAKVSPDEEYSYLLNSVTYNENTIQKMPQELAYALRQLEEEHPELEDMLLLRTGQVGVELTDDGDGFSYLCYPAGALMSMSVIDNERGCRCLDRGDGWEVQMYYAPKG